MLQVISGCSSGGKSTLINALLSCGYRVSEEPGREVVRESRESAADQLPWGNPIAFAKRCVEISIQRYEAAARGDGPVFFDRSLVDAVSALCFHDPDRVEQHRALLDAYRYAPTVFMAPPWPEIFELDEDRQHSYTEAVAEFSRLEKTYIFAGYTLVHMPRVSVNQRVNFVLSHLEK